jgi:hypothetical protein
MPFHLHYPDINTVSLGLGLPGSWASVSSRRRRVEASGARHSKGLVIQSNWRCNGNIYNVEFPLMRKYTPPILREMSRVACYYRGGTDERFENHGKMSKSMLSREGI